MAEHQLGGQQAVGEQLLRAVDVGEHRVEQARALDDAGGDALPFLGADQVRQQVQRPRPVGALGVGVDVVGDAVFENLPIEQRLALFQLRRAAALEVLVKLVPVRADPAARIEQFVISPRVRRAIGKQVGHQELDRQF